MSKIIVSAFALLPVFASADVTVGADEDVEISVERGEVKAVEGLIRAADGAAGISKTGGGTLTVPLGNVWKRGDLDINVREGTLSVSAEGSIPASDPENPPAAMQKAAFWIDAGKNTAAWSEDESRVKTWYDVRETRSENGEWGAGYFRAVALPAQSDAGVVDAITNFPSVNLRTAASCERAMMYFHGMNSGSFMRYAKPDGVHGPVNGIVHAFAVIDIEKAYGWVLSSWNGDLLLHPGRLDFDVSLGRYANLAACGPALPNGIFRLDGNVADPGQFLITGVQVIEIECGELTGSVETIFSDRNMKSRYGGDWVGEIVLFTNRLSAAERLDVSEYLLRKWKSEPPVSAVNVNLAYDTVAEVAKSAMSQVNISGTGTVSLDGEVEYVPAAINRFAGTVRIKEGADASVMGVNELPVAIEPGDRIATSGKNTYDVFTASRTKNAADAAQFKASHTGAADLRVTSLAGVKEFSSGAGQLTLSAPRRMDDIVYSNVHATIAGGNANFERLTQEGTDSFYNNDISAKKEKNGWTLEALTVEKPDGSGTVSGTVYLLNAKNALDAAPKGNSWLFGFNNTSEYLANNKIDIADFYPEDNGSVAIIKTAGRLSADVDVPETGDYELSFDMETRVYYDTGRVTVSLVDENGSSPVTNVVARFLQPNFTAWRRSAEGWFSYRFLIRNAAKGAHRLLIESEGVRPDADCCAILDNFEMKLVSTPKDKAIRAFPPNASFEVTDCPYDTRVTYSKKNTVRNWTLVQGAAGAGDGVDSKNYEVCFSARWHGNIGIWFNAGSRYGESQLLLRESNGYAQSDVFALPPGIWRLHFRGARWAFNTHTWNGHNLDLEPTISASVMLDGEEQSLGTSSRLPQHDFTMREYMLPDSFTVSEGTSLTLRLRQGTPTTEKSTAAAVLDEVWFERADRKESGEELVANGNMDANGKELWAMQDNKRGENLSQAYIRDVGNSASFGYTTCGDKWALLIVQVGQATQQVTFPEAGLYRLSFWTRCRYTTSDNGVVGVGYGGNQIKAWLADGTGGTQEICRTQSIFSTNFFEQVAMFNVEKPGTYTFGLQGCNEYPDNIIVPPVGFNQKDSNVFIDCVSIKKASDSDMPELDEELKLDLAAASKLRLDFAGTATIKQLRLGGRRVSGLIDASHPSGLVSGPGCLYIQPRGTVVTFR